MRTLFQAELAKVGEELLEIATMVRAALDGARTAFLRTDLDLAQQVISDDQRIDHLQDTLDERSIDILARESPVAGDLRMIVSALRMSASLERMGDLARHLAQDTRRRFPDPVVPQELTGTFRRMFELDLEIVDGVVELLAEADGLRGDTAVDEHVRELARRKAEVSRLQGTVFEALAAETWSAPVTTAVDVTLASRYLERISDHGLSVASKISYLATGHWAVHLSEDPAADARA